jgi:DNA-binding response OmpR family regulator
LRSNANYTPILMLTALGRPEDVIKGFESGTDDYLTKPFDLDIFIVRMKGLLRRSEWTRTMRTDPKTADKLDINGRTIDFANLELKIGDEIIHLTLMEIKLLRYLIENEGVAVSRKSILEDVWGLQEDTDTRAIDNFIVRLRKYFEDEPNNPKILRTVRGIGYRFTQN